MRPVALGRKNWVHIGSAQAGPKIAAILSIVESCRRLKLPVHDYLAAVFPDSLIARSSAYQTLLPRPGSPSIHRLERQGCWREGDFTTVIGTNRHGAVATRREAFAKENHDNPRNAKPCYHCRRWPPGASFAWILPPPKQAALRR